MHFPSPKTRSIIIFIKNEIAVTKQKSVLAQKDVLGIGNGFFSNTTVDLEDTPPPRPTSAGGDSDEKGRSVSPRSRVSFEAGVDQEEDYQTSRPSQTKTQKKKTSSTWMTHDDPRRAKKIEEDELKARRKAWKIAHDLHQVEGEFEDKNPTFFKIINSQGQAISACADGIFMASQGHREYIIDSGASNRLVARNQLHEAEKETI